MGRDRPPGGLALGGAGLRLPEPGRPGAAGEARLAVQPRFEEWTAGRMKKGKKGGPQQEEEVRGRLRPRPPSRLPAHPSQPTQNFRQGWLVWGCLGRVGESPVPGGQGFEGLTTPLPGEHGAGGGPIRSRKGPATTFRESRRTILRPPVVEVPVGTSPKQTRCQNAVKGLPESPSREAARAGSGKAGRAGGAGAGGRGGSPDRTMTMPAGAAAPRPTGETHRCAPRAHPAAAAPARARPGAIGIGGDPPLTRAPWGGASPRGPKPQTARAPGPPPAPAATHRPRPAQESNPATPRSLERRRRPL